MENRRKLNNYAQLFCISCFKRIDIELLDQPHFITCPHCKKLMTLNHNIKNDIKIYYLKYYEEVA
jgi:hypothetical protein